MDLDRAHGRSRDAAVVRRRGASPARQFLFSFRRGARQPPWSSCARSIALARAARSMCSPSTPRAMFSASEVSRRVMFCGTKPIAAHQPSLQRSRGVPSSVTEPPSGSAIRRECRAGWTCHTPCCRRFRCSSLARSAGSRRQARFDLTGTRTGSCELRSEAERMRSSRWSVSCWRVVVTRACRQVAATTPGHFGSC